MTNPGASPIVSIIMIFLDAEEFIEEAIDSVFQETFHHWELLLVDDGSADHSPEIARRHSLGRPGQVRYLAHPGGQRQGMSASRNLGLEHANGHYVAFLDADDIWLPNKLERQVALLDKHRDAAMVCGPTQWWHSWNGQRISHSLDTVREIAPFADQTVQPPSLAVLMLRERARTPATCSVLLRREVCRQVGGFEAAFPGMYEDQAFFVKIYLGYAVHVSSDLLDRYRQHPRSFSVGAEQTNTYHPSQPNRSQQLFLQWLEGYIKHQAIDNSELNAALVGALRPYREPIAFYSQHPVVAAKRVARKLLPRPARHALWVLFRRVRSLLDRW